MGVDWVVEVSGRGESVIRFVRGFVVQCFYDFVESISDGRVTDTKPFRHLLQASAGLDELEDKSLIGRGKPSQSREWVVPPDFGFAVITAKACNDQITLAAGTGCRKMFQLFKLELNKIKQKINFVK